MVELFQSKLRYTVFDLITAPALITTPHPPTSYFIFTYYRPLDNVFPDFLLYFHLLSPIWRSFGTSGREQIYVSAPGAYEVEYGMYDLSWYESMNMLLWPMIINKSQNPTQTTRIVWQW